MGLSRARGHGQPLCTPGQQEGVPGRGGGASLPALAQPPPQWHVIRPGDSALERLGSAHARWPSLQLRLGTVTSRREASVAQGLLLGAGAVAGRRQQPLREALGLGFSSPWLLSRSP